MSLQDDLLGVFGASQADADTVSLMEEIITNEANGKTGVPDFSWLPSLGGSKSTGSSGWGISILNPYLRAFVYQQENPITFPLVLLAVGFLSMYGLAHLIEER